MGWSIGYPVLYLFIMPKTHERHKKNSFQKGDLVEYIGRDTLQRGIGVVLEEVPYDGFLSEYNDPDEPLVLSCVRVYWQNLGKEETLHKARVRRVVDVIRISKNNAKKASTNQ